MTILAGCFSLTLGAWRVRLRLDIDEPREVTLVQRSHHGAFAPRGGYAQRRAHQYGGHR